MFSFQHKRVVEPPYVSSFKSLLVCSESMKQRVGATLNTNVGPTWGAYFEYNKGWRPLPEGLFIGKVRTWMVFSYNILQAIVHVSMLVNTLSSTYVYRALYLLPYLHYIMAIFIPQLPSFLHSKKTMLEGVHRDCISYPIESKQVWKWYPSCNDVFTIFQQNYVHTHFETYCISFSPCVSQLVAPHWGHFSMEVLRQCWFFSCRPSQTAGNDQPLPSIVKFGIQKLLSAGTWRVVPWARWEWIYIAIYEANPLWRWDWAKLHVDGNVSMRGHSFRW